MIKQLGRNGLSRNKEFLIEDQMFVLMRPKYFSL